MYSSLRFFRYAVLGLFLACNAIIATAAIWNLNLLQNALFLSSSLPVRTDAFLVFVGCAGLALIFPIVFCEIGQKHVFLVSVWFECIWVGLFAIFELAGAASASAAGADYLCPVLFSTTPFVDRSAICASSQLLQAFSWICGVLLLSYFVLLFVTSLLRRNEDNTIWRCNAARFPWESSQQQLDTPIDGQPQEKKRISFIESLKRRVSSKPPTIAQPRPRNAAAAAIRRTILSYRSGLSADWGIEHFRPEQPAQDLEASQERPLPPAPLMLASEPPSMVTREATAVTFSGSSLYPQHMQSVLPTPSQERQARSAPPPRAPQTPPQPPSPSPIGQWPRVNPVSPLPKRKTQKVPPLVAESRSRQPSLPRTSPARPHPAFDFESPTSIHPSSSLPTAPPTSFSPSRSRPSGPRRPSLEESRNQSYLDSYSSERNPSS
ncbi:hypothetical protein D9611_004602 [Ephemerocybe angulata]|uniref:MARVEL domain-containing protein n=1 Tax=Ephemerocybe angulata TaxID=980116 RepID=A0A8H5B3C6_9AGAR|nr:hypothetical protein D9611_004602 [Tulosesus angulatus]